MLQDLAQPETGPLQDFAGFLSLHEIHDHDHDVQDFAVLGGPGTRTAPRAPSHGPRGPRAGSRAAHGEARPAARGGTGVGQRSSARGSLLSSMAEPGPLQSPPVWSIVKLAGFYDRPLGVIASAGLRVRVLFCVRDSRNVIMSDVLPLRNPHERARPAPRNQSGHRLRTSLVGICSEPQSRGGRAASQTCSGGSGSGISE